ncbi:MAG: DivIVA domain-containing protein [Actinomycetota bacterium]
MGQKKTRGKDTSTPEASVGRSSLTPIDVQQKEFRVSRFGGYKMRDVDEFLDQITDTFTAIATENDRLRAGGAAPMVGSPDLDDVGRQADEIIARARAQAARITGEAKAVSAAAAVSASGPADRVAVNAFLSREREFLQSLAGLVQEHAEAVKGMAKSARPASGRAKPAAAVAVVTTAAATTASDSTAPSADLGAADAPATDAPATDAPATSAPATGAPATGAPATDAPATSAPATGAPATGAPATGAPATDAPATDAPATGVPVTDTSAIGETPAPAATERSIEREPARVNADEPGPSSDGEPQRQPVREPTRVPESETTVHVQEPAPATASRGDGDTEGDRSLRELFWGED